MLFNSYTFIIFFTVVLGMNSLPLGWRQKKFILLCTSYLFYAAWNPPFIVLLWISTLTDWIVGRYLYRSKTKIARKLLLVISLSVNLGLLCFFKYADFLLENFVMLMEFIHVEFHPLVPDAFH